MPVTSNTITNAIPGPVLITGHTGFKGTWLTLLLEALNVEVVGLSLPAIPHSLFQRLNRSGMVNEALVDIRNIDEVNKFISHTKPSSIFHLAAQPLVLESYKSPVDTFAVNVVGTANILDASFKSSSVQSIVVSTTDKVYRNDSSPIRFKESDPLGGKDPYSASKVGTENVVLAWQNIKKVSGGPRVVAVRAGNVIGGGDWAANRIVPDLVRAFKDDSPIEIRNPQSTRPWQHVLDPLRGYISTLLAINEGKEISAINFGPSEASLTVRELVSIASRTWPNASRILFGEGSDIAESVTLDLDSSLAQEKLNWKPFWTQQEAIESTFAWWKGVLVRLDEPLLLCRRDIDYALSLEEKKAT